MLDLDKLLSRVMGSGALPGLAGGVLGGGLTAGLLGSKKGRKLGKSALKLGGIAAVGALAYYAYTKYRDGQAAAPEPTPTTDLQAPPAESGFVPPKGDAAARASLGTVLIHAMIAAAKADGAIDADEQQRVFARLNESNLDAEERSFLLEALSNPVDVDALVRPATTPEIAAEIYTASLMAIEVDTPAERAYLSLLAARLELPPGLVSELESAVAAATERGAA